MAAAAVVLMASPGAAYPISLSHLLQLPLEELLLPEICASTSAPRHRPGASLALPARAEELPEYRLKAAFVFNFMLFTEWPDATGATLKLCIHGKDPFGTEIDGLQGKAVAGRSVTVHHQAAGESLKTCQVVFIAASAIDSLPRVLEGLKGQPVLTVADSPGAMQQGVALNMGVAQGKVSFEANLKAARAAGLNLSSKMLRLAAEVQQ